MIDWSEKVALVTGASRGFGRAAAQALGAAGAQVVAVARTQGGLEELDDAIQQAGGPPATLVPMDLNDEQNLARMGAAIHARWGRLDLWLHTAFWAPPLSPAEHIARPDLDRAFGTNVATYQRLIHAIDPLLRAGPAPLALIAGDDQQTAPFHGLYAACKAAQGALTQAWAAGSAARLRVVEVVPPAMPTALRGRFHPGEDRSTLTDPSEVAGRLMAALTEGAIQGEIPAKLTL